MPPELRRRFGEFGEVAGEVNPNYMYAGRRPSRSVFDFWPCLVSKAWPCAPKQGQKSKTAYWHAWVFPGSNPGSRKDKNLKHGITRC